MNERYERYNAMTFEAYCKTAIDRAVNRGRRQKNRRAQQEISMSELSESMMGLPCEALEALTEERTSPTYFQVGDFAIPVHDEMLAKALLSLSPQRRSILLLAYFLDETDESIARSLNLSRSAVQRRRAAALELLRDMMGGGDQ
jgi:DNA-directed RNA polymerase specialized sigma24 family protein